MCSKDHGDDDMDMETLEHVRWSDKRVLGEFYIFSQDWRPAKIRGHGVGWDQGTRDGDPAKCGLKRKG